MFFLRGLFVSLSLVGRLGLKVLLVVLCSHFEVFGVLMGASRLWQETDDKEGSVIDQAALKKFGG